MKTIILIGLSLIVVNQSYAGGDSKDIYAKAAKYYETENPGGFSTLRDRFAREFMNHGSDALDVYIKAANYYKTENPGVSSIFRDSFAREFMKRGSGALDVYIKAANYYKTVNPGWPSTFRDSFAREFMKRGSGALDVYIEASNYYKTENPGGSSFFRDEFARKFIREDLGVWEAYRQAVNHYRSTHRGWVDYHDLDLYAHKAVCDYKYKAAMCSGDFVIPDWIPIITWYLWGSKEKEFRKRMVTDSASKRGENVEIASESTSGASASSAASAR